MLSSRSFPDECWALSIKTKFAALPGAINPQSRLRILAVLPVAKQIATSAGTSPNEESSDIMRKRERQMRRLTGPGSESEHESAVAALPTSASPERRHPRLYTRRTFVCYTVTLSGIALLLVTARRLMESPLLRALRAGARPLSPRLGAVVELMPIAAAVTIVSAGLLLAVRALMQPGIGV